MYLSGVIQIIKMKPVEETRLELERKKQELLARLEKRRRLDGKCRRRTQTSI